MTKRQTEQRAREVTKDLLRFRGWQLESPGKSGQCLEENEYKNYEHLSAIFKGQSKSGKGDGYPDFLLVDSSEGLKPLLIIETKASASQIDGAVAEAIHYGKACANLGHEVIAMGIAGGEKEICQIRAHRQVGLSWKELTLANRPIDWIPSPKQTEYLLKVPELTEVQAEKPSNQILAQQAERLNEILRECKIKDEYRPVYIATFMLGLWQGEVSTHESVVLTQINANAQQALISADKPRLQNSLSVDIQNNALAARAWEIIDVLKKVNIRSFLQEHDYLGQLYETFFRYTGGNTIGQYFTPRHIIDMICELLEIDISDKILDPACGTGGFLVGALNRMVRSVNKPYEEVIKEVKDKLFGIESEPATAALCLTNMILRGDGKSGIVKDNCFTNLSYPKEEVDFVLMNPPFPHKKSDTPATDFIDRGLKSLKKRGILASIVPYSLLVNTGSWHQRMLKENTLYFVATLPFDVFQPYASYDTAILMIQKGVPHDRKRVFMSRVSNDGYKVKKKARIEREGGQIATVLEAFRTKSEISQLTSFPEISSEASEWTPENYIRNKSASDGEFLAGLENSIRKQASFYIAHGSKIIGESALEIDTINITTDLFSNSSSVSLSESKFGEMLLSEYFDIVLGGKDEIEDLQEGNFPIVSTSEFMNGVSTWKKPRVLFPSPSITVATDGSVCSSFVQEFPFYAFYKVAILTPRPAFQEMDVDALYYISYLISRERWRYVYARKFGKARISKTILTVPITEQGVPDFAEMGKIIRSTRAFPIVHFFRESIRKQRKHLRTPVDGQQHRRTS
ncbi:MAG: N-6 DNA methylase [Cyclobacteriaceae bacterium]|nr:N-6 DNA methylase [Cyclobacteriaceae bacterium HetDA_MAG_MS6]